MIREASLSKVYWFIKKKRFRKKQQIYKKALTLMIDKTTAVYLGVLVVYLFCSIFIFGDYFHALDDMFIIFETTIRNGFWLILTALPIRYVFRSLRDPGVVFSTTEYQLGMLPYKREHIWLLTAVERIIRQLLVYILIGAVVMLLTPITNSLVLSYIILLFIYDVVMLIPQWKLYQQRFLTKVYLLCAVIVINGLGAFFVSPIVGLVLFLIIISVNFGLFSKLFTGVKWEKVTEYSDFKIWNMQLIASASKVKFKRNKKYGIFVNSKRSKKPFHYTTKSIHWRLWKIYFGKNVTLVMQLIGMLLLMLLVFPWISSWLFQVGIAVTIYAYSSVAATFFSDRFQTDMLEILPWDLSAYRKTFFKWFAFSSIVLLLPMIVYLLIHWTLWSPLQLVFYISTFIYIYNVKMKKASKLLAKESVYTTESDFLMIIFLVGIVFSGTYPALSIGTFIILLFLWIQRGKSVYRAS